VIRCRLAARLSILAGAGIAALAMLPATAAQAHPLGNFTVNQYAGLRISPDAITVDYVLDMAELPAYQTRTQEIDTNHDGTVSDAENTAYAQRACTDIAAKTHLTLGDQALPASVTRTAMTFPPGAAGLVILRLECGLRAAAHINADATVHYRTDAYTDRIGWREVTAIGDRVTLLHSDVPDSTVTKRLTQYPVDALKSPREVQSASVQVRPGGAAATDIAGAGAAVAGTSTLRGVDRLTGAFTTFVGHRNLSIGVALLAVVLSLVLGAAHAVAPGHGKTVMAAYLIGQRGSLRQALAVASTVAATHTVGVLALGVLLATSVRFAPQQVYGWLAVASGALIALVGASLLRRAYGSWRHGHAHSHHHHEHGHESGHGHESAEGHESGHDHEHGHDHSHSHDHVAEGALPRIRSLMAMGFAGGLSPSPSAVVVLLGAVALGRAWFGVLLVLGYGIGMAATLTGVGFALAKWRVKLERRTAGRTASVLRRLVPVATSGIVVLVGLGIAAQAAISLS
jgi:ABC-type nickel/cobalt efflux system permease component RcnA